MLYHFLKNLNFNLYKLEWGNFVRFKLFKSSLTKIKVLAVVISLFISSNISSLINKQIDKVLDGNIGVLIHTFVSLCVGTLIISICTNSSF